MITWLTLVCLLLYIYTNTGLRWFLGKCACEQFIYIFPRNCNLFCYNSIYCIFLQHWRGTYRCFSCEVCGLRNLFFLPLLIFSHFDFILNIYSLFISVLTSHCKAVWAAFWMHKNAEIKCRNELWGLHCERSCSSTPSYPLENERVGDVRHCTSQTYKHRAPVPLTLTPYQPFICYADPQHVYGVEQIPNKISPTLTNRPKNEHRLLQWWEKKNHHTLKHRKCLKI